MPPENHQICFLAADQGVSKFLHHIVQETWYKKLRHSRTIYTAVPTSQLIGNLRKLARGLYNTKIIELLVQMRTFYADAKGVPEYIKI